VAAGLAVVVFVCSYHLIRKMPDISGVACLGVLFAYCAIFVVLTVGANKSIAIGEESVNATMIMGWNVSQTDLVDTDLPLFWKVPPGPEKYSLCRRAWGSYSAPVYALDLAQLASIVYEPDKARIPILVDQAFNEKGKAKRVEYQDANDYRELPRYAIFKVPHRSAHKFGMYTKVIAVKGTSTKADAYVDMTLWSAIRVLQTFQTYVPVLSILPISQIQWLMERVHLPGQLDSEQNFFNKLEEVVKREMEMTEEGRHTVVLTGHSLGGGLAQTIAAKLGQNALVWSAPGFEFSSRRFRLATSNHSQPVMQASQRIITNVMPKNDLVPQVDRQAGTVQDIECRNKHGEQGGPAMCHKIEKTICELWRVCGDGDRNRSFAKQCGKFVKKEQLAAYYEPDDVVADAGEAQ